MRVIYRGHEINVRRERCLGGWDMLYTSIFRVSDGYECTSFCEDSGEKVRDQIGYMKRRIDAELATDDPWCEREYGR